MATFRKRSSGWRAEVARRGIRDSATFKTKAQAAAWATQREADILAGKAQGVPDCSLRDVMERYLAQETPKKRSAKAEEGHMLRLINTLPFVDKPIAQVTTEDLGDWRDSRLQRLKPASVARDFSLLSAVFTQARREWKLIAASPVADLKKPSAHKPRDRRINAEEEAALLAALGYVENHAPQTKAQEVAYLFLLALETAMRKGEILGLSVDSVYLKERFATLPFTKNGTARNVPLSSKACKLLALLIDNAQQEGRKRLFVISHDYAKHLFASACKGSQITDLHFHDTRHEATTRLARKLDVLDLARMTGHKDIKSLMAYYNATASEMARRLD